ncbi:hypothetical protein QJQ45_004843 [Haematococcus lacustris]|nr:hypothetical protein QJQ45_004843 [Haematococcus lacustris]
MWHGAISSQGAIGGVLEHIPHGLDPVLPLGALIVAVLALCPVKFAMGRHGPRRRAALARENAIRAKLSPTELSALETALATPQQLSGDASTCWGHKRPRTCLGRSAQQQLSMDQQQLQGAQHQLAVDQQLLQDAQRQVALDQQQLQGAQHQLAVDLEQLQGTQHQLAQALKQMQNGRMGLERSELLLRQHMDACMRLLRTIIGSRAMHAMFFPADGVAPMWSETACACVRHMGSKPQQCMCHGASTLSSIPMFGRVTLASDKKEDAECLRLLHARAPHIASAHMTLNVHLLKEYARECLGWKGKRLTQKKPLLRADILEHLRWEQEMEEDQLAEVGVDEADEIVDRGRLHPPTAPMPGVLKLSAWQRDILDTGFFPGTPHSGSKLSEVTAGLNWAALGFNTDRSSQAQPQRSASMPPMSRSPMAGGMGSTDSSHGRKADLRGNQPLKEGTSTPGTFSAPAPGPHCLFSSAAGKLPQLMPNVRTGLDAVKLFASSAAKPGLLVFCNLNPACEVYNPYDLVVVKKADVDPHYFYTITQTGVTHMWGGLVYELVPHYEWIRDAELYSVLKKLVLFAKRPLFTAFRKWHSVVRSARFQRRQRLLSDSLLSLSPTFSRALLAVRRMTQAATDDPSSGWRRHTSDKKVSWVHSREAELQALRSAVRAREVVEETGGQDDPREVGRNGRVARASNRQGAPGSPGKKGAGSVQGRVSPAFNTKDGSNAEHQQLQARTTSGQTKQAASGLNADASFLLPSGDTHIGPHSDSSRPNTLPGQGSSSPTSPTRAAAVAAGLRATSTTASHVTALAQGSPPRGRRGARSLRVAEGDENGGVGAAVAPSHTLLGLTELLPQAGLAAQLGRVGGPLDLLTLAEFRKLRAETKGTPSSQQQQLADEAHR